jgi:hypothetical protein
MHELDMSIAQILTTLALMALTYMVGFSKGHNDGWGEGYARGFSRGKTRGSSQVGADE